MFKNLFSPVSTISALRKLLTSDKYALLQTITADQRLWYGFSAEMLQLNEGQLMNGLSQMVKLSYIKLDSYENNHHHFETVKKFYQLGALPVIYGNRILGAYAINPENMAKLLPRKLWSNIMISCWSDICERFFELKKNRRFKISCPVMLSIFESTTEEARMFGAGKVIFFKGDNSYRYKFITNQQKEACGDILADFTLQIDSFISSDGMDCGYLEVNGKLLPIEKDNQSFSVKLLPAAEDAFRKNYKILHIEDDELFCEVIKSALTRLGYDYEHSKSGYSALQLMLSGRSKPDLIICDLLMSNGNGTFLIKELNRFSHIKIPPIIILSSSEPAMAGKMLIDNDYSAFVSKSEDPSVLIRSIKTLLK